MAKKILIKGAGEHSSGTAHRLFKCGFPVVMTETASPTAVRRSVAFCSAVFHNEVLVEDVRGIRHDLKKADQINTYARDHIPVFVDPDCTLRKIWKPDVIIDGRILKRNLDNHIDDASIVIGFGPGFVAGRDVHYVVETNRGHNMGRIIKQGSAEPNTGTPGPIAGESLNRVIRSPASGQFNAHRDIGDIVQPGDLIGAVGSDEIRAAISGVVRGLIYPGSDVFLNQKLGDIDPRSDPSFCSTISEKARCLSGSVLEIILSADLGK